MNHRSKMFAALLLPSLALGGIVAVADSAQAAGYAVFTQGASALGEGNAVTAHSNNPSTIFFNPALINKLQGTQIQAGTTVIRSSQQFSSNQANGMGDSNDSTFFPSTIYATHKINDKVSVGLGVFSPFGLGTEWNGDWDGRYLATKSKLETFNINPVISYQVHPSLSVAAGLDVVLLDASLEKKIQSDTFAAAGVPYPGGFDISQKFKGDGKGVGFNLAAAYDINEDFSVGASYRSQVQVDVDGDATFTNDTLPTGALNSPGHTSITLPPQFTAGVAYKGIDRLTLEGGVRWEGWSKFKELTVQLDNGMSQTTPRNWKDSWGLNAGGRYQIDPKVALLAGYIYGENTAPSSTFDPSIPDSDTHVFSAGTELDFNPVTVGISYGYQLYENRTKNNGIDTYPATATSAANGKYESHAHLIALSMGYKF